MRIVAHGDDDHAGRLQILAHTLLDLDIEERDLLVRARELRAELQAIRQHRTILVTQLVDLAGSAQ